MDAPNTPNSEVTYRIETGARDKFQIDSITGQVTITEDTNLDRDVYGISYLLKITANNFDDQQTAAESAASSRNGSQTDNVCF